MARHRCRRDVSSYGKVPVRCISACHAKYFALRVHGKRDSGKGQRHPHYGPFGTRLHGNAPSRRPAPQERQAFCCIHNLYFRSGPANLNSATCGNSGDKAWPMMAGREGVFDGQEISAVHGAPARPRSRHGWLVRHEMAWREYKARAQISLKLVLGLQTKRGSR
jgi:hypothetical protein